MYYEKQLLTATLIRGSLIRRLMIRSESILNNLSEKKCCYRNIALSKIAELEQWPRDN